MRNFGNRQVLFGGSGGKRNGSLNVFGSQAGEIPKNFFGGISVSQTGEHSAESDTRALEDGFAAADPLVTNYALFVVFQIASSVAHVTALLRSLS